jgi:GTPase SAR1 family protein
MRDGLIRVLDTFDRAAAACAVVPGLLPERAAETAGRIRRRLGLTDRTVVAAIAGGTGSGKSSLLNALVGDELAMTGPRRPTTERALAAVSDDSEPGLIVMLDQLGIDRTVATGLPDRLALIDLPDTDSTVAQHRMIVEDLFPHLDLVVWVVDPEKYHDRVWHDRWLRPHADLYERFRFVLNQTDRLSPAEVADITIDLTSALEADGIESPRVVIAAADPPLGPPVGADALLEEFERVATAKETALERMRVDLAAATKEMIRATTFDLVGWEEVVTIAAGRIAGGDASGAETVLQAFVDDRKADLPELEGASSGWGEVVAGLAPPRRRWWQRRRPTDPEANRIALDRALTPGLRRRLAPRAAARAAVAELQLDLIRLEPAPVASTGSGNDHP